MAEITLTNITAFLDSYFGVEDYSKGDGGIYRPSERSIRCIGLALEPWSELPAWIEAQQIDALFLHRPWKFDALLQDLSAAQSKIENLGVLFYHLPFDEYLTPGDSPRLADVLLLSHTEPLGAKDGRSLGMIGDVAPQSFADVLATMEAVFGGIEEASAPTLETITRIAVVGAMTDALVREAGERGAQAYLTGQFRAPAHAAVREWGMGVIAIGHRRSEEWGLRALAGLLRERFANLEVFVAIQPNLTINHSPLSQAFLGEGRG